MNWYRPLSLSSLKSSIHHFAHLVRSWHHHTSILWLDTERPYIKLLSLENESRELLRRNRWIPATKVFSVPKSGRTIRAVHPTKYFASKAGSLFEIPTSSYTILLLQWSILPCMQNPNGFSLSKPLLCHKKFGPLLCIDAFAVLTPSRSKIICVCFAVSLATTRSWSTTSLCHIDR